MFILLPFHNSNKRLQIVSLCVCQCQKQWQRYSCGMQAVHVTFMKGDMMINSSGLLKVMSLSVPKIKTIALYYTPQAPKLSSWQDPLTPNPNHSTSSPWHKFLYKCRQFDNQYYSTPFYTHQKGYKMCLAIDSNVYGSGKGTRVSIFVGVCVE